MTGERFAHCPTCPNTPEFKPYIDDKNDVYVYNPETNTASLKVTPIQEVTLTGKAKSSDSGPGSLALAALMVSQADSPAPGPADVVAVGMLIGAGVWWTYNQFTQPSYTTIADPGVGMRNLKTEDSADEDKDVNGADVPQEGKLKKSPTGKGSVLPSERDPKRVPTAKEKKEEWNENNQKCANCEKETSLEDTRSHHYPKRWSDGGRKTVPVCKTCHQQLHKK